MKRREFLKRMGSGLILAKNHEPQYGTSLGFEED